VAWGGSPEDPVGQYPPPCTSNALLSLSVVGWEVCYSVHGVTKRGCLSAWIFWVLVSYMGACSSMVEALCSKLEGLGFVYG